MKNIILLCFIILLFIQCNDTENSNLEVSVYTSESFNFYDDYFLNAQDLEILEDGTIVLVGNGKESEMSKNQHFFLTTNQDLSIDRVKFYEHQYQFIYKNIDINRTREGSFFY